MQTKEFLYVEFLKFISNDELAQRASDGLPIRVELVRREMGLRRANSRELLPSAKPISERKTPFEEEQPPDRPQPSSEKVRKRRLSRTYSQNNEPKRRLSEHETPHLEHKLSDSPIRSDPVGAQHPKARWRLSGGPQRRAVVNVDLAAQRMVPVRSDFAKLEISESVRKSVGTLKKHSLPPVNVTFQDLWATVGSLIVVSWAIA